MVGIGAHLLITVCVEIKSVRLPPKSAIRAAMLDKSVLLSALSATGC
jgi:hypothetical protein